MYEQNALAARQEQDELSIKLFVEFMDDQSKELAEWEVLMSKVKAYTHIPGLYYHLDHELRK